MGRRVSNRPRCADPLPDRPALREASEIVDLTDIEGHALDGLTLHIDGIAMIVVRRPERTVLRARPAASNACTACRWIIVNIPLASGPGSLLPLRPEAQSRSVMSEGVTELRELVTEFRERTPGARLPPEHDAQGAATPPISRYKTVMRERVSNATASSSII